MTRGFCCSWSLRYTLAFCLFRSIVLECVFIMDVKIQKESFERIYAKSSSDASHLRFPLAEIDKFDWDRGPFGNEYYSYHYRRFTCHILSRLSIQDGQQTLIVGCGAGLDEKNIIALYPNTKLWSIDISEEMIKKAVANRSPSSFAISLAEALPFREHSFDRVLAREVIEHVMDPQKMIFEISRVLKPQGIAVVTTENEESFSPRNFYAIRIRPKLARLLSVPLPAPKFKDEAPTLAQMKNYVQNARLDLVEYFWDGALYKCLLRSTKRLRKLVIKSFRKFFRFKVASWAHWFSCLENNRTLAYWFCDQAKYVLRKPEELETAVSYNFNTYGFPPSSSEENEQNLTHRIPVGRLASRIVFRTLDFLLNMICYVVYFGTTLACAAFVKKNDTQLSNLLATDNRLMQYLKKN